MVSLHTDTGLLLQTKDMDTRLVLVILLMVNLPHQVTIPLHLKATLLHLRDQVELLKDTHMVSMVLQAAIIHHHHPSIIKGMVHLPVVMDNIGRLAQVIRYLLIQDQVLLLVLLLDLVSIQVMTRVEDIHHILKEVLRLLGRGLQDHHLHHNDKNNQISASYIYFQCNE